MEDHPVAPSPEQRLEARMAHPDVRPVLYQQWSDLLFLHWTYPAEALQARLPDGLTIDTFNGKAYLGVVPFFMSGIRPRFLPAVPWLSRFQELNVRTYVHDETGHPGVWFFTLDASNPLAVALARRFFHLPYRKARMSAVRNSRIQYDSTAQDGSSSRFVYPLPERGMEAAPESLEFFLLERYYLFAHDTPGNRLYRGQVQHRPYRFRIVNASEWSTNPIHECGLTAPEDPPCHQAISPGMPVRILPLQRLR